MCAFSFCVHIYMYTCKYSRKRHTGWGRLKGCLQSQVIFRKRATDCRALWRKMTYEDKASYDSTPPHMRKTISDFILPRVKTYC